MAAACPLLAERQLCIMIVPSRVPCWRRCLHGPTLRLVTSCPAMLLLQLRPCRWALHCNC